MGRFIRFMAVLWFGGLLAACSGGPELAKLNIKDLGALKNSGKAVVILSTEFTSTTLWGSPVVGFLHTTWSVRKKGSPLNADKFMVTANGDVRKAPRIAEIPPGKYDLLGYNYTNGNMRMSNSAGMRGLPLASFTVKAGEVVYLGNLSVSSGTKIKGKAKFKMKLVVSSHEALARAHLAKTSPALVSKMQTRLIKLSPLLALLQ